MDGIGALVRRTWIGGPFMPSPMGWFYGFTAIVSGADFMRLKVNAVKTSRFWAEPPRSLNRRRPK